MTSEALDLQRPPGHRQGDQRDTLKRQTARRRRLIQQREFEVLCAELERDTAAGRLTVTPETFERSNELERTALVEHTVTVADSLRAVAQAAPNQVAPERRLALLSMARDATPRVALMLSGGGTLGNYHYGVVRSLLGAGLLPKVISGASAGSMIGAVAATRDDKALATILRPHALSASRRRLDGSRLSAKIAEVIPDMTFAEAAEVSGRRLTISVTSVADASALVLNAETTPHVLIRRAVLASCAVPYSFPPVQLVERPPGEAVRPYRPGFLWADGSLSADMPAAELKALYGVGLTVTSLVNPLILPWIRDPHSENTFYDSVARLSAQATKFYLGAVADALAPLTWGQPDADFMRRAMSKVATQRYVGDINILPRQRWHDPRRLLDEADAAQLRAFMDEGEQSANRRLDMLRACTLLDRTLDLLAP